MPDRQPTPDRLPGTARAEGGVPARDATPRPPRRSHCPRCGAPLGTLAAGPSAGAPSLYCGCCGLVVPAA